MGYTAVTMSVRTDIEEVMSLEVEKPGGSNHS